MREEIKAAVADCYEKLKIEWNVDVEAYPSIIALFESAFEKYGDSPACSSLGHALSYRELDRLSGNLPAGCNTNRVWPRGIGWRFRCPI